MFSQEALETGSGDHTLQCDSIVKEEFIDDMSSANTQESEIPLSLNCSHSMCFELNSMDLCATVKVDEMTMNLKKEEHHIEEGFSFIEAEIPQQLLRTAMKRRLLYGKIVSPKKLMKVAKEYACLFSNKVRYSFPQFWGPTIIQCPGCMVPRRKSPSAFLELIDHVIKKHDSSKSLLAEISHVYRSLIACMSREIYYKKRSHYCEKLRKAAY